MTLPTYASHGWPHTHSPLRLSDPGDLLAAVPAFLGFYPERSLVAICLGGRSGDSIGTVMRHDLVLPSAGTVAIAPEMVDVIGQFVPVCVRDDARSVVALIVDDTGGEPRAYDDVIDGFAEKLRDAGIDLASAHMTTRLVGGERWWSLGDDVRCGTLPEPETSSVAVTRVLEGRTIRGSRADLEAVLSVGESSDQALVAAKLAESRREIPESDTAAVRCAVVSVLRHVERIAAGRYPDAPGIVSIARALSNVGVRDVLLGLAVSDHADAAEELWLTAARLLPEPQRAAPATLLGFHAYVRGDGALAGVAFTAALEADPGYRLAAYLDTALRSGLSPSVVASLADAAPSVDDASEICWR